MSDYALAVAAIEERLSSNWTATPLAFENDRSPDIVGPDGERLAFVLCEVTTLDSRIKSIGRPGDHVTVDKGMIELTVFVPRGSGRETARAYAVQLAALFRTVRFFQEGGGVYVQTWTPVIGPGNPSRSENPSGSWWAILVSTPFDFYHRA